MRFAATILAALLCLTAAQADTPARFTFTLTPSVAGVPVRLPAQMTLLVEDAKDGKLVLRAAMTLDVSNLSAHALAIAQAATRGADICKGDAAVTEAALRFEHGAALLDAAFTYRSALCTGLLRITLPEAAGRCALRLTPVPQGLLIILKFETDRTRPCRINGIGEEESRALIMVMLAAFVPASLDARALLPPSLNGADAAVERLACDGASCQIDARASLTVAEMNAMLAHFGAQPAPDR